ncbi:very short patch repair endonuclease [Brevundimonas staleyi]|uniref:Very short patch repair endonuclease n=1 Tax=Brevundimonas staleyi TaxID=74326 RepID=A0ABW0FQV8_9CAUL
MKAPLTRSEQMSRVKGRDTRPEWIVRRALHGAGLRYRLQARDLPGRPDIVFRSRRLAVFIHGCFWHRHDDPDCRLTRTPKTRVDFWEAKFAANQVRDARDLAALRDAGWTVITIWECQLRDLRALDALVETIRAAPAREG